MTEKQNRPGTFVKGDPRINRNGRPKSFDALRKLAQQMSHEVAKDRDGNEIIRNGHKVTHAELLLFQMLSDKKQREKFLEIAFGKVPQPIEIGNIGDNTLQIGVKVIDYRHSIAALAPRPVSDSSTSSENESAINGETLGQDGAGRSADDDGAE